GIRDLTVTGVQTCALPISRCPPWLRPDPPAADRPRTIPVSDRRDGYGQNRGDRIGPGATAFRVSYRDRRAHLRWPRRVRDRRRAAGTRLQRADTRVARRGPLGLRTAPGAVGKDAGH